MFIFLRRRYIIFRYFAGNWCFKWYIFISFIIYSKAKKKLYFNLMFLDRIINIYITMDEI